MLFQGTAEDDEVVHVYAGVLTVFTQDFVTASLHVWWRIAVAHQRDVEAL